jgi:hypothetical protein
MSDPRGTLTVSAGGVDYRLHFGFSSIADLQAIHGDDVIQRMEPPAGAGADWVPGGSFFAVILDAVRLSLHRFHRDAVEADPFLVDDLIRENPGVFAQLIAAAFPAAKADAGNGKRPRRAA